MLRLPRRKQNYSSDNWVVMRDTVKTAALNRAVLGGNSFETQQMQQQAVLEGMKSH